MIPRTMAYAERLDLYIQKHSFPASVKDLTISYDDSSKG